MIPILLSNMHVELLLQGYTHIAKSVFSTTNQILHKYIRHKKVHTLILSCEPF